MPRAMHTPGVKTLATAALLLMAVPLALWARRDRGLLRFPSLGTYQTN